MIKDFSDEVKIIEKCADEVRKKIAGGTLYGKPIISEDDLIVAAYNAGLHDGSVEWSKYD